MAKKNKKNKKDESYPDQLMIGTVEPFEYSLPYLTILTQTDPADVPVGSGETRHVAVYKLVMEYTVSATVAVQVQEKTVKEKK